MQVNEQRPTSVHWALIALALVVAAWLRFRGLAEHPFWLDEAYSAFGAEKGFRFIWQVLPTYETHPPFYSAALRSWTLVAGTSLNDFRLFGVVAGMLSLPALFIAARELERSAGRNAWSIAVPVLLFAAVSASMVDISRLVRPYYLQILVNALGYWAILRLARAERDEARLPALPWATYLICLALLVWLHNLGSLFAGALGLAFLILVGPVHVMRNHGRQMIFGHLIVLLAIVPAWMILLDQSSSWVSNTWLVFRADELFDNMLLIYGLPGYFGVLALALIAASILGVSGKQARPLAALLVAAIAPPLVSLILTLTIAPVFLPRTLVASTVPLLLVIAAGASRNLVTRGVTAFLIVIALIRAVQVQALPPEQNWYGAINWLMPRIGAQDQVYAYPNEGALPLRYALRDLGKTANVRDIPSEVPARDPQGRFHNGSRGVQVLTDARLAEIASDATSRATPTVWLLRLGKHSYDPKDSFLRILARDRAEIARFTDRDIEIIGLKQNALIGPAPPEQTQP